MNLWEKLPYEIRERILVDLITIDTVKKYRFLLTPYLSELYYYDDPFECIQYGTFKNFVWISRNKNCSDKIVSMAYLCVKYNNSSIFTYLGKKYFYKHILEIYKKILADDNAKDLTFRFIQWKMALWKEIEDKNLFFLYLTYSTSNINLFV